MNVIHIFEILEIPLRTEIKWSKIDRKKQRKKKYISKTSEPNEVLKKFQA